MASHSVPQQLSLEFTQQVPYEIRVSTRSKRIRIEVTPLGDVRVVVPRRFNHKRIPAFVAEHRQWLNAALTKVNNENGHCAELRDPLPSKIKLPAISQTWRVHYVTDVDKAKRLRKDNATYFLRSTAADIASHHFLLRQWLQSTAKQHLVPLLDKLSRETGLDYASVAIRGQKTRWGSCSAQKRLNINRNALLLPPHLVQYLLLHELCHTVHLNHSGRYWSLVKQFEPRYREYEKELNQATYQIPVWACNG